MERKPISWGIAGIILGVIMVIYGFVLQMVGLEQARGFQWLSYLIFLVGIIIFIIMYAKAMDNFVTFGNLWVYGFKITAIATVILVVCLVIITLMFPEYKEKVLEASRTKFEEDGKMTPGEIDRAVSMIDRFYMVGVVGGTLFVMLVVGAIGSLIGAAIPQKKPVNPFDQTSF